MSAGAISEGSTHSSPESNQIKSKSNQPKQSMVILSGVEIIRWMRGNLTRLDSSQNTHTHTKEKTATSTHQRAQNIVEGQKEKTTKSIQYRKCEATYVHKYVI